MPAPNGPQWKYVYTAPTEPNGDSHLIEARTTSSNRRIGNLQWFNTGGVINDVYVHPDYRRRGIATGMWDEANRLNDMDPDVVSPNHSSMRSRAGDEWAKSVGGDLPPLYDNEHMEYED